MVQSPYLEELRLTSFKSFRDAVLPLRDLTVWTHDARLEAYAG